MSKTLILIPARYGSSRFPGKPMAKIFNTPMIEIVLNNCLKTGFDCAVVTDNNEIETYLSSRSLPVVRVNDDVETGSERIAIAYERFFAQKNYDFVVNVQGDEPALTSEVLIELSAFHKDSHFDVCTALRPRTSTDKEDFINPNVVKCAFASSVGACLYFSRAPIPFARDVQSDQTWYQHIGLYSYRTQALRQFVKCPPTLLEQTEKLEQLRALENGLSIGAIRTSVKLIGVDVPEDIKKVEELLQEVKGD